MVGQAQTKMFPVAIHQEPLYNVRTNTSSPTNGEQATHGRQFYPTPLAASQC